MSRLDEVHREAWLADRADLSNALATERRERIEREKGDSIAQIRNALVPVKAFLDDHCPSEDDGIEMHADAREGLKRTLAMLDELRGAPRLVIDEQTECSLGEFLAENLDGLSDEDVKAIASLSIGESYRGGGGAAGEWTVARVR